MRLNNAVVELEEGILHIRIPLLRVIEEHNISNSNIRLTKREEEVLRGLLDLKRNKEIACELNICERTVRFHVGTLLRKYKVMSRMELVEKIRYTERGSR